MTFLYFAYGSNLWPPQLRSRCSSAKVVGSAVLAGWRPVYDKPGADGTAKLSLTEDEESQTHGVVYEIDDDDRADLDRAEPGYTPFMVPLVMSDGTTIEALTYRWSREPSNESPADWYVAMVKLGASHHGLPETYVSLHLEVDSAPS